MGKEADEGVGDAEVGEHVPIGVVTVIIELSLAAADVTIAVVVVHGPKSAESLADFLGGPLPENLLGC